MNKFGRQSIEIYHKNLLHLHQNENSFQAIQSSSVSKLLKNVEVNKADGIENISGRFLEDGVDILATR